MDAYFLILSGLVAIYDYVVAHTLFCLVPAFFIAGAMASLIPKSALLPYLGKNSPKIIAYPLAVVSGLLLAVCSCTVLPLFAGIKKGGAGIGPAIAFLYTAPATNIIAVLYTGSLIGWDVAAARIIFSIIFAVATGLIIARLFSEEDAGDSSGTFAKPTEKTGKRRLVYLFACLIAILLVGTRISEDWLKYGLTIVLVVATYAVSRKYFSSLEVKAWLSETWGFAKMIFPLLLAGVFFSGIIRVIVPDGFISSFMGSTNLISVLIPVLFGIFVYFPTLVEVPMAKAFVDLGMAKGPLLAYLLADPVVSLPSILVVSKIMGKKRTLAYVLLILIFSVSAGLLFGSL